MPASFECYSAPNGGRTGKLIGSREPSDVDLSELPVRRSRSERVVVLMVWQRT